MKKLFFYAFFVAFLSVSCDTSKEFATPDGDTRKMVATECANRSLDEAVVVAKEGFGLLDMGKKTRANVRQIDYSTVRYKINSKTRSGVADTLLYILNFADNQGFALVAANRAAEGLVAIAESGSFDGNTTGNIGFDMYMEDTYRYLASPIKNSLIDVSIQGKESRQEYFVLAQDTIRPMTTVQWDQKAPFNLFASNPYNPMIPSGCVATAIATAMSAYSYPSGIELTYDGCYQPFVGLDWTAMNSHDWKWCSGRSFGFSCETCRQIAYLSREIGQRVNMNYQIG